MRSMKSSSRAVDVRQRVTSDRPDGRDGASRRITIVSAAARLFDERGYHQTSMNDIAAAVGIRKPTIYHYVESKEELLSWIHEEFIDLLTDRLAAREALGLLPSQQLFETIADILELMDTHRGHVRVFFEHHRELSEPRQSQIKDKRDAYQRAVEDIIRAGIDAGEFALLDVRLTALALFGMCNWAYQWYRSGGPLRSREIAYSFWNLLLNGLRAPPADGSRSLTDGVTQTSSN